MKFTVSTKPLSQGLELGVINNNISKFFRKSCLAQVTASSNTLTINLEAASIVSEIILKGFSDDQGVTKTIFVDCLVLKQLVSTFEASTTVFEFVEGGLILHSGNSKFTLPKLVEDDELSLDVPLLPDYAPTEFIDVSSEGWKFIKDRQMYAIAMSFIHPVYTKIWVGNSSDVLVGDFDNSIFTYSNKIKFGENCLLSDTIVNLMNSLPENAKMVKNPEDGSYTVTVYSDSFSYISQFKPSYEADPDVGSYHSEMILDMMTSPENHVCVNRNAILKFINQASLLSSGSESTIRLSVSGNVFELSDENTEFKTDYKGTCNEFSESFKTTFLHDAISHYTEDEIYIAPAYSDDEITGIIIWTDDMHTALGGAE